MDKTIQSIQRKVLPTLKKYGVKRAGIFGSYAHGEQKKNSDIDMLVEVKGRKFSLLDMVELEYELKKTLRKKVDLLTYNGISPFLRERILKEEIRIV